MSAADELRAEVDVLRSIASASVAADAWLAELPRAIEADDFSAPDHRLIWRAIAGLREAGRRASITSIEKRLRDDDARLAAEQVAAWRTDDARLYQCSDTFTAAAAQLFAARRRRDAALLGAEYAERIRTGQAADDLIERMREAADGPGSGTIAAAWTPVPLAYVTTPPPARRWLLRHPADDGAPGRGDGMLPLGKAGLLSADGGVGKTTLLATLAVCVATGRKFLGCFEVAHEARSGRVLLALAEEDAEDCHRKLFDVCLALGLSDAERAKVAERVVLLPLAGRPVSLVQADGKGRITEAPTLGELRRMLASNGPWSLVVLDPLARWAGCEAETSNEAATRFVQAVETLCEAPGSPTVLVAHHSSKAAAREGSADSRGVSGLRNGFRWEATLTLSKAGAVAFQQTKSNYSRPMPEALPLVRLDGGILRAMGEAERAHHAELAAEHERDRLGEKLEINVARVVEALARAGEAGSANHVAELARMKASDGRVAVQEGKRRGLIIETGTARKKRLVLSDLGTSEASGTSGTLRTSGPHRPSGVCVAVPPYPPGPRDLIGPSPEGRDLGVRGQGPGPHRDLGDLIATHDNDNDDSPPDSAPRLAATLPALPAVKGGHRG